MNLKKLAIIAKGTRRKKRDVNILEVAEKIESLYKTNKSLKKVSKLIKLSPEMVRQFLKVNELNEEVQDLIKSDQITSIDVCYRLSKLNKADQKQLAFCIVQKKLSSDDVRAIVKYKIANPKMEINKVIEKVIKSKDFYIYIAYLGIEEDNFVKLRKKIGFKKDIEKFLKSIFDKFISEKHITYFELNGRVVILKVIKSGLQKIKDKAKELNVPVAKLANVLVKEYLQKE